MSFNVYRSSAGSGKTFTLVKEYLKLVLNTDQPGKFRHILAITFTNKAATEMKSRILDGLSGFAKKSEKKSILQLLEVLQNETGLSKELLIARSEKCLRTILHNYSDFSITTIDKFTQRIVKSFSNDLNLPWNFETELDAKKTLSETADIILSRVGTDEDLSETLLSFCFHQLDQQKNWRIERNLAGFSEVLLKEYTFPFIKKFELLEFQDFKKIRNDIFQKRSELSKIVAGLGREAMDLIGSKNLTADDFAYKNSGVYKLFERSANGKLEELEVNSHVSKTIQKNELHSGTASPAARNSLEIIKPDLLGIFHSLEEIIQNKIPSHHFLKVVGNNLFLLSLLKLIKQTSEELQLENNQILISEFNRKISELVLTEPVPFIYERIGERYQHFMIDEFQDTSILQFQNLVPLLENSLGYANMNLIVGDGKQAIYRWRGGEVEQFRDLPSITGEFSNPLVRDRERILTSHYKEHYLKYNFRSKKEIVDFNNSFFEYTSQKLPPAFAGIYQNHKQVPAGNDGGFVRIEFVEPVIQDGDSDPELLKIVEIIDHAKDDNYNLRDIAILCRDNKKAALIASYLQQRSIPVISPDSLLLGKSNEVNFILSCLKYYLNPMDEIAFACMMRNLRDHTSMDKNIFHEKLRNKDPFFFTREIGEKGNPALYGFIENIVSQIFPDPSRNPYIHEFLESSWKYISSNSCSLGQLLEWWEEKVHKTSLKAPDNLDAIRIMTIHSSKGLEFPIVIYPFANGMFMLGQTEKWIDINQEIVPGLPAAYIRLNKGILEGSVSEIYEEEYHKTKLDEINLLYVCMTRAEERLYILTSRPIRNYKFSQYFIDYLSHIGLYQEACHVYEFGVPSINNKINKQQGEQIIFNFCSDFNYWVEKFPIAYSIVDDDAKKLREKGILIHEIFSKIKSLKIFNKILNKSRPLPVVLSNEEDEEGIVNLMQGIGKIKEIELFFSESGEVLCEPEIISNDGSTIRPDRVIIGSDLVRVLDFKTGQPKELDKSQVRNYAEALKKMGFGKVEAYILYTSSARLEQISVN